MYEFANKIKELRIKRNMTQAEFAERLGVTKSSVSSYENGTRLPSYDILIKISRIFKVSIDNLLGTSLSTSIDTTGLTYKQITMLSDIISIIRERNKLYMEKMDDKIPDEDVLSMSSLRNFKYEWEE